MAPSINGSSTSSACSIQQMQPEISCSLFGANRRRERHGVAAGAHATCCWSFLLYGRDWVTNTGAADAAASAAVHSQCRAGLYLVLAAEAAGASCTLATTSATCTLGALNGSAARDVALTLRAAGAGAFDLTATVDADEDGDAGDNADAITVTRRSVRRPRAIRLVAGRRAGTLKQRSTWLANSADGGATSAAVTAALSAGLYDQATLGGAVVRLPRRASRARAAPWAAQGQRAACRLLQAAAGAQQLTINTSASEAERAPTK